MVVQRRRIEQVVLVREVTVDGAFGDAGHLGDALRGGSRVADLGDHLLGRRDQAGLGAQPPLLLAPQSVLAGVGQPSRSATISATRPGDCSCTKWPASSLTSTPRTAPASHNSVNWSMNG